LKQKYLKYNNSAIEMSSDHSFVSVISQIGRDETFDLGLIACRAASSGSFLIVPNRGQLSPAHRHKQSSSSVMMPSTKVSLYATRVLIINDLFAFVLQKNKNPLNE